MGLCASTNKSPAQLEAEKREHDKAKALDTQIHHDIRNADNIKKLLLLGAGESGKSTLFKQINNIYGEGFNQKDREEYIRIIHSNVIKAMKVLVDQSDKPQNNEGITLKCEEEAKALNMMTGEEDIDETVGGYISVLWADPCIQKTFLNRSKFQLEDSTDYFFDKAATLTRPDWEPSDEDILRARVRTTGIIEKHFTINDTQFEMFDVGGQRNERKKWMHCFEGVTAVLFVGVLSEYDLVLYEDDSQNRMVETLDLYQNTINAKWFINTALILFLNKRDLFEDKIKTRRLSDSVVFRLKRYDKNEGTLREEQLDEEYTDAEIQAKYPKIDTYDGGCKAIESKFKERNENPDKLTYTHITCATDRNNVSIVFDAVKDIIINHALDEAGLLN